MARTSLPPGFRFHPTDIELIMYYLKRKVMGKRFHFEAISELNIYKFSPWDLPDHACLKSKDLQWYFFCPRERKYSSGDRVKRGTESGFWKTTGKDRNVMYDERVVGQVKTLVFHEGSAPKGRRTDWLVHEYRLNDKNLADAGVAQDVYVLYKVFKKNGPGPKNGAQYGAPFKEEDWDDDDKSGIPVDTLPSTGPPFSVVPTAPGNQNIAALKSFVGPVCTSGISLDEAGPSSILPSSNEVLDDPNNSIVTDVPDHWTSGWALSEQDPSLAGASANDIPYLQDDDIAHLLAAFQKEEISSLNKENYELVNACGDDAIPAPHLDRNHEFSGLEGLNTWAELSNSGDDLSDGQGHNINKVLPQDDMAFLELDDLDVPMDFSAEAGGSATLPLGSSYAVCNPDVSEHVFTGIPSTQYGYEDSRQICYNFSSSDSRTVFPGLDHLSVLPNSSVRPLNSATAFPREDAYGNSLSQGYAAGQNMHFPYRQQEESGDTAENQERGLLQRNSFSRLQQFLESFPVHPASVAEHLAPSSSAYGGSSIHVKAEVTRRFSAHTKDALSVMLGESTYDYCCWWKMHGAEFLKNAADCCSAFFGFCFGLMLGFMWILLFSLLLGLGCHLWMCISFPKMIAFSNSCTTIPLRWNTFYEILHQFYLASNSFLFMLHALQYFALDMHILFNL